ncbi:MAG: HD domain-containing protein [Elusimicrobiota bacterium]|nr:HD domain-containing protein [Endomicrobiia bacterium]MDW8166271.1 HD domain-containing protein [Elusimicrobiota bacterium]
MKIKDVRKIIEPQFGYIAKSTGEFLYVHHFNVWSIFRKICKFVTSLDKREKYLLEIACLVHDIGKMDSEIQNSFKNKVEIYKPHKITSEKELKNYFEKAKFSISERDLKFILDVIRTHHSVSYEDLEKINTSAAGFYTELLCIADWLASMELVSLETIERLNRRYKGKMCFTIFECSRFPSPTYNLIIHIGVKHFKNKGWEPICYPKNGVVFIGQSSNPLCKKEEILKEIIFEITKRSLKLQDYEPQRPDRQVLVPPAKYSPLEFLETHQQELTKILGENDRGFAFLKYYKELIEISNLDVPDNEILKLIRLACSSAGNLKNKAKEEYYRLFKRKVENQKELLNQLFYQIKLSDIFKNGNGQKLCKLKQKELYDKLKYIAEKYNSKENNSLNEYLNSIILMEEERDFRPIVKDIFEKYKIYKKTADAERGICEICGCSFAFKMQPAINPSRTPQAFSQIKSKYAYRSICLFCTYDNLVLRENTSPKKIRIFLKIKSKVPDLFLNYTELRILINKILSAVRNPRNIIKFKENKEFQNFPFPDKIEIPVGEKEEILLNNQKILIYEDTIFFPLEDINIKDFSPKDVRVKYEPLYHIMRLMGFEVDIGAEEQNKLFGEEVITEEETYYRSLATILLARLNEKKSRKYIYSRNLLENSPSITIKIIGDHMDREKKEKSLPEGLIKCLVRGLVRSKILIAGR